MQSWTEKEDLGNGIICYRGVIKKEFDVINRLEETLGSVAGYGDFKFKKTDMEQDKSEESIKLQELWQDVYDAQFAAVEDYRKDFNIMPLRYWEAFNFIKYGPGQHFMEHHDHGYSYNCTVSLVAYVNDDYEGGELFFRLQGLNIKPKAGDLYIFPSNFMYPHQAMPVHSGTKYSIVTMLDYSRKFHTPDMYDPKWENE
jgi:predicted 2-oxoglutarate/Fe(II)-dependent dioxygenase YbiX